MYIPIYHPLTVSFIGFLVISYTVISVHTILRSIAKPQVNLKKTPDALILFENKVTYCLSLIVCPAK